MSLSGDLSTLDLAGLLQNLETHEKFGMLTIEAPGGTRHAYFHRGRLALVGFAGRPGLMETLVACGTITREELEAATKKRRRTKKSIGEVLVQMRALDEATLRGIAEARLLDEACELVATGGGAFTFTEGGVPRGVFDPEERRLGLSLPAGPLLLESARREDHWRLVRERVPSDSAHFVVQRPPKDSPEGVAAEILPALLDALDGSRSVTEAMARFPHRRFEAMELLSDLVGTRAVREAASGDLARLALETARHDGARAASIVGRGLEVQPRNVDLLRAKAELAEAEGVPEAATEARKMLVHLALEAGERAEAKEELARLKTLAPKDPAVWDKSFQMALEDGENEVALKEGRELARLYREPGLFKKAAAVFERIAELDPDSWELVRDLARARAEAGDPKAAVAGLLEFGEDILADEEYGLGRRVFEEILALAPRHAKAKETLARIQSGELARRRERLRRWKHRALLALALLLLGAWLRYEGLARRAYVTATATIDRDRLIEEQRYAEAIQRLLDVRQRYPFATTAWYDVRLRVRDLAEKSQ